MNLLIVIPARGGSKGLPGKNVRLLNGKPLIQWSIETAKGILNLIEGRLIVSTDDSYIKEIVEQEGVSVPFLRPAELASDAAATIDVLLHAIQYEETQGRSYTHLCLLEPTSPQRSTNDVLDALKQLGDNPGAHSIVGIGKVESGHPVFLARLEEGFIKPFEGSHFEFKRRQEISDLYFFEGSLYISEIETLKLKRSFYHESTLGYLLPKWKNFEIDDEIDFNVIESLMKIYKN